MKRIRFSVKLIGALALFSLITGCGEPEAEDPRRAQYRNAALNDAEARRGSEFLAKNRERDGVTETASGLQYEILQMGQGDKPTLTDRVRVHYQGSLVDGTVFDSSYERGVPAQFPLRGVIKGWTEALQLMPVGSKWQIYIPPGLAYGSRSPSALIPANATLVFQIELLDIAR